MTKEILEKVKKMLCKQAKAEILRLDKIWEKRVEYMKEITNLYTKSNKVLKKLLDMEDKERLRKRKKK